MITIGQRYPSSPLRSKEEQTTRTLTPRQSFLLTDPSPPADGASAGASEGARVSPARGWTPRRGARRVAGAGGRGQQLTCSSSCIEAARGSPSATRAIIVSSTILPGYGDRAASLAALPSPAVASYTPSSAPQQLSGWRLRFPLRWPETASERSTTGPSNWLPTENHNHRNFSSAVCPPPSPLLVKSRPLL